MKKLILTLVFVFTMGTFTQINATTSQNNIILENVDECAEWAGAIYEGSRLRGMSIEDSFNLANDAYNDCIEME